MAVPAEGKRAVPKWSQAEAAEAKSERVRRMVIGNRELPHEARTQLPGVRW